MYVLTGLLAATREVVAQDGLPIHNITQDEWFLAIQAAVDDANDGDEIVLSPGTYTGAGNRDVQIAGKSLTIGGSDPENPFTVASTVIDCQGDAFNRQRAFRMESADPFSVTLRGLTIRNGSAPLEVIDGEEAPAGGAIYCVGGSLTLDACVLDGNSALARCHYLTNDMHAYGGAIYHVGPVLTITRCSITANKASNGPPEHFGAALNNASKYGGAIHAIVSESMRIENSMIANNLADSGSSMGAGRGGGIYARGSAIIRRCQISSNSAKSSNEPASGGGVLICGSLDMSDCDVVENGAGSGNAIEPGTGGVAGKGWVHNCRILRNSGGGVSSTRISNCIIANNDLGSEGNPAGAGVRSAQVVENCLIIGNSGYYAGGGLANVTQVRNCTILGNYAQNGAGVYKCGTVANCIIWVNNFRSSTQVYECPDITHSCIEGWTGGGKANTSADPRFKATESGTWTSSAECVSGCYYTTLRDDSRQWAPGSLAGRLLIPDVTRSSSFYITGNTATSITIRGNASFAQAGTVYSILGYNLQSCSPCVDAGDPGLDYTGQTDIDGEPRVILSNVDIGADEFNPETIGPIPGTPADAVAAPPSVCPGECATLSARFCEGGDVLEWFAEASDGTPVPGGSAPVVCPESTTTYFVRALNTSTGQVSGYTSAPLTVRNPGLWQPVNPAFDKDVSALIGYNGEMIVGGRFSKIGEKRVVGIAAWDGSNWRALGGSMEYPSVSVLRVYNGEVIAAGLFGKAGGVTTGSIAAWNGSSWRVFGNATGPKPVTLEIYDGELIAGGSLVPVRHIASRWDGQAWRQLATDFDGTCLALAVYRGELIVGGSFTILNGVPVNRIARWNSSEFKSLAAGLNGSVSQLLAHENKLIVVGSFTLAGEMPANRIASWDGISWTPMDSRMAVARVAGYHNELVAVGTVQLSDGTSTTVTARWTGSGWQVLGPAPAVGMLTQFGDELYAGGSFPGGLMNWGCWPVRLIGDIDGDLAVDGNDLRLLEACSLARGVLYDPGGISPECPLVPDVDGRLPADLDRDGDIDMDDFALFQRCRTGNHQAASPACKRTIYE